MVIGVVTTNTITIGIKLSNKVKSKNSTEIANVIMAKPTVSP